MTSPTEDVYEAAARAGNEANALTDRAILWPDDAWFRAAVDSAYAAGVAAGRTQAAADIEHLRRELHALRNPTTSALDVEFGGTITFDAAGGEPRG